MAFGTAKGKGGESGKQGKTFLAEHEWGEDSEGSNQEEGICQTSEEVENPHISDHGEQPIECAAQNNQDSGNDGETW